MNALHFIWFRSALGILLLHIAVLVCGQSSPLPQHEAFTLLLKEVVSNGNVDYPALKKDPAVLQTVLQEMGAVSRTTYDAWPVDRQLAFLINLYNASTLALIVEHPPVKSIKDIGSVFRGPWDQRSVVLWGKKRTLNELEHDIIRKQFPKVPEIHFALVCAAKGCPPLRPEAYEEGSLRAQLREQRTLFLADSGKNRRDASKQTLYLSPIFKWYGNDFIATAGSIPAYLRPVWPEVSDTWRLRYTRYDWSLNEQ